MFLDPKFNVDSYFYIEKTTRYGFYTENVDKPLKSGQNWSKSDYLIA